jgi:hypothetical protein
MLLGITKKRLFLIVVVISLVGIVFLQFSFFSSSPKSTMEILKTISSKKQNDFYGIIKNIPQFDPQKHSDGCSGGMSATYAQLTVLHEKHGVQLPWRDCCVIHDEAYYKGGSKQQKLIADQNLKQCVSETIGEENLGIVLGIMMEKTVNIGGLPYFPTSYRWGYGEDFKEINNLPTN